MSCWPGGWIKTKLKRKDFSRIVLMTVTDTFPEDSLEVLDHGGNT